MYVCVGHEVKYFNQRKTKNYFPHGKKTIAEEKSKKLHEFGNTRKAE